MTVLYIIGGVVFLLVAVAMLLNMNDTIRYIKISPK